MSSWVKFAFVAGTARFCAAVISLTSVARPADTPAAASKFGFGGPEIFPIEYLVSHLRAADIDGDGRLDLIVANNARSKINILFNQTGKTNKPSLLESGAGRDINKLPPDARFRIDSISSEKRISALVVADLNSDGRPDIAYFGEPKELVVQYNQDGVSWSPPKRWPLEDGSLDGNALTSGDLNADGRTDLALLADGHLYLLFQGVEKLFEEPAKMPYSGLLKSAQVVDVDGDARNDLLLVNWETAAPVRIRFQNEASKLGPEIHFTMPAIRSYWTDDFDGDKKHELVTISAKSGRAQLSAFKKKPAEPLAGDLLSGQFQVLPVAKTSKPKRGYAWADVDGDQRQDLLVADPDGGQVTVFPQQADGSMGPARSFPTLTGVTELEVADWDGDGKAEVFFLSNEERQLGVSTPDAKGRLPFPSVVALPGRPLAFAIGRAGPSGGSAGLSLAVILDNDGKRDLRLQNSKGEGSTRKLAESFKSNPVSLTWLDVDQDGLNDLVVLIPYEKIKFLIQQKDGTFDEQDLAPPGGGSEQPWLSAADVDGDGKPEMLLPQKNFIRAVVLQSEPGGAAASGPIWSLKVKEQINGPASSSRIVAATALQRPGLPSPWLFLLDAEKKSLAVCGRDAAGVWQIRKTIQLPVTDFQAMVPLTLGGGVPNALAFQGAQAAAWLSLSGSVWELSLLDDYDTPIKDGFLTDVLSGDLNHDGRRELVFLETAKNHIDVVTLESGHQLASSVRWQVFEERTFRNRRSDSPEPREAFVGDFTGDKKNDLAVLVHDRVLLYPQE